ncbi:hypothetical protein FisN_25Lh060 [Fistulifera solaris]|uniref:Uncharacterized protein n=1 Tax=Fistulifera solaris TaxID=1519565 RepID=A0A1Z5KA12_FISSO|nr:hypothetical protein FisN_25Lh060 [Fistulifera solaris]|eukprot:GAX23103.1 hypothetical protein FisN_25Lh060 [Fistulifera solaris]
MTISLDIQQVEHEQSQQQKRLALGQCQSCGQQLYGFEKRCGLFSIFPNCKACEDPYRKVPLTIPQLVERGQCLRCDAHRTSRSSESCDSADVNSTHGRVSPNMEQQTEDLSEFSPKPSLHAEDKIRSPPLSFVKSKGGQNQIKKPDLLALGVPFLSPRRTSVSQTERNTATYSGPYNSKGEKHGEGTMTWSNGDVYKGQFVNDRRSGHGVLTFASDTQHDNGEYVGDWANDNMHGSGTRRYPNGDVYVGKYANGKREGEGRFYFANGDLYFGEWENNQMHGSGLYYFSSGVRFEGTFLYNKRNGKGKTQNESGYIDIFQYINDERVGQGVRFNDKRTQAWRLTPRHDGTIRQNGAAPLERQRISVAEAVSLVYEIEQAAQYSNDELISSRLPK